MALCYKAISLIHQDLERSLEVAFGRSPLVKGNVYTRPGTETLTINPFPPSPDTPIKKITHLPTPHPLTTALHGLNYRNF